MKTIRYQVTTKRTDKFSCIDLPVGAIPFLFKYVMVGMETLLEVHYLRIVKKRKKKVKK